jgi:hypothetical protein
MENELGWKEAIEAVLEEAKAPMHYQQIAERIYELKLKTDPTATPDKTVASTIAISFRNEGTNSPFIRTSRGFYALSGSQQQDPAIVQEELEETASSDITGVVNAFGMFWERSKIFWGSPQPSLLGQQQYGSKPVDFAAQKGVYLLHDSQGVLYVGRVTDQNLVKRLSQHTSDRLAGRWTRFSWFGVFPVEPDGALKTDADFSKVNVNIVIATMEAVLIEGLEPRQNRKRGDDFQAIEYLQVEDPKLELNRKLAIVQELASQITSKAQ